MKYPKYLLLLVWLLISSGFVVGQTCYKAEKRHSGFEAFYEESEIESKACELASLISGMGGGTFTVYGIDFYPVLAYVDPTEGYEKLFKSAVDEKMSENYLMIVKEWDVEGGVIGFKVALKLPSTPNFAQFDQLKQEAITSRVQKAIAEKAKNLGNNINSNPEIERAGIETLMSILNGEEIGNIFVETGFEELDISNLATFDHDGTPTQGVFDTYNQVFDYTGLRITEGGSTINLRDFIGGAGINGGNLTIANLTWLYIITDNAVSASDMNLANDKFEDQNAKMIMWLHFDTQSDGMVPRVYLKVTDNLSEEEIETILDFYYIPHIANWTDGSGLTAASHARNANCSLSWQWGKNCILPTVPYSYLPEFPGGVVCGLLDGLLGTIEFIYEAGKKAKEVGSGLFSSLGSYFSELKEHYVKNRSFISLSTKVLGDVEKNVKENIETFVQMYQTLKKFIVEVSPQLPDILAGIWKGLVDWMGTLLEGDKNAGYTVGLIAFEVITAAFSGGTSAGAKFLPKLMSILDGLVDNAADAVFKMLQKSDNVAAAATKRLKCKILGTGCFVSGTPVLMANKYYNISFGNTAKAMAVASMPIVAVPIQEVQLLDYAVAHKTVNASYGLTANADDTYIIDKDPYASDQQRSRDQYEINDTDWHSVSFEGIYSSSVCHLAMYQDWIKNHGYVVDGIVNMNLPEQGISGPFKITSIKHIIPQKKPLDEDLNDEYEYRPVTGLFIHQSDQVHNISFDNNETIGVTAPHPIFSTTHNDWRLAGELEVGEKVLTYLGETTVTKTEKTEVSEAVYNLEVKDLHNFLVGGVGVVVHNTCWNTIDGALNRAKTSVADLRKMIKDGWDEGIDWNPIDGGRATGYFGRGRFFEGLLWKGKYRKNGYKYTGLDDLGEGIGSQNYPVVDVYKGNTAVGVKTTRNSNPWSWINMKSSTNVEYNKKHIDDIIAGMDQGPGNPGKFGTHTDLQNVQKFELDVYIRDFDTPEANVQQWQQMVDDYLTSKNQQDLIGKVKVNLAKVEDSL